MRPSHSKQKYIAAISFSALLAYTAFLFYENKLLTSKANELAESTDKLSFLLSLERPTPLTPHVKVAITKLDDHMYSIKNNEKEKKFSRCMMQAVTDMTGSLGLYIDLKECGEHIENKSTLTIFTELDNLEVASECQAKSIQNQYEFDMCRRANEDYSAKTNAMNHLFKLITSHSLWEMHLISKGKYGKY